MSILSRQAHQHGRRIGFFGILKSNCGPVVRGPCPVLKSWQKAAPIRYNLTLGLAPVVDHGIDAGIEAKSVYTTVRSGNDGVATASVTAAGVAITRFTGAMDWAEAVHGEKIVVANGSASTTAITDPKEIVSKAVSGSAGMVLTAVGGAKTIESRLNAEAPKTGNAPEVDPKKAPTTTEAKNPPNPNGKNGGPEHQAKVAEIEADIKERGLTPQREHMVKTPDGEKGKRFVDVVAKDADGKVVEMHQVGKQTKAGEPVARERRALDDIEKATKDRPRFWPYN